MSKREQYAAEGQYKTAPSSPRRDDPSPQSPMAAGQQGARKTAAKSLPRAQSGLKNIFQKVAGDAQNIFSQMPSLFNRRANYNFSLNIPGQKERIEEYRRDYANYLENLGSKGPATLSDPDLFNFFERDAFSFNPPNVKMGDQIVSPMDYGDYLATVKGSPGIKFSGDVGNLQKRAVYDQFGNKTFEYDQINDQSPQGLQLLLAQQLAQQQMNPAMSGIGSLQNMGPRVVNNEFLYGIPV